MHSLAQIYTNMIRRTSVMFNIVFPVMSSSVFSVSMTVSKIRTRKKIYIYAHTYTHRHTHTLNDLKLLLKNSLNNNPIYF